METEKQEYLTEEMINEYLNKHKYSDKNGVVHTTDTKFFIEE